MAEFGIGLAGACARMLLTRFAKPSEPSHMTLDEAGILMDEDQTAQSY